MVASSPASRPAPVSPRLLWHVFVAPLRHRATRSLLALLAIALGVALATAVAVIHRSAQEGFAESLRSLGNGADLQVVGGRDEVPVSLYAQLIGRPEVEWVAPVMLRELRLVHGGGALQLMGLDPLVLPGPLAGQMPGAFPSPAGAEAGGLLRPHTVLLSESAAAALSLAPGERFAVLTERGPRELEVIGHLPAALSGQRLAVADIATVHALFGTAGRVSRLDLRLSARDPAGRAAQTAFLAALVPPGVELRSAEIALQAADNLSRAYRVNLSMLALMALLTGGFLVFAVQAATMLQRRQELALLRALGLSRRLLLAGLLAEAATLGVIGSALGIVVGVLLAVGGLHWIGGDLGAGYFAAYAPRLTISVREWGPYMLLGITAALAGAWLPARAAVHADPARALRAGDAEASLAGFDALWPAAGCAVAGTLALGLPAVDEVPWGGYLAIGLWLTGAVLALPGLARRLWWSLPLPRQLSALLALAQLRGTARLVTIGAGGVLAATAVAAAMAIMVFSFRTSVDRWLADILVADVYLRLGRAQTGLGFDAPTQAAIAGHPAVAGVNFVRYRGLLLDPKRPPVTLIARPLDGPPPPALATAREGPRGMPTLWASEAMSDIYGWRPGNTVHLPIADRLEAFFVAGLWRDYVRSYGAVIVDLRAYQQLTGDLRADEAGVLLQPGVPADGFVADLRRQLAAGPWLEAELRQGVRQRSLALFDRSFAATYALEFAALVIGLAGVAASFAAQASGRLREFGVLLHLGLSRRALQATVAIEGAAVAGLGVCLGLLLAAAIAIVLIEVVNRQSFHWSMDLVVPWAALAGLAVGMLGAALLAALAACRGALGAAAVRAVREDW